MVQYDIRNENNYVISDGEVIEQIAKYVFQIQVSNTALNIKSMYILQCDISKKYSDCRVLLLNIYYKTYIDVGMVNQEPNVTQLK